jgi:hypothetical protein
VLETGALLRQTMVVATRARQQIARQGLQQLLGPPIRRWPACGKLIGEQE